MGRRARHIRLLSLVFLLLSLFAPLQATAQDATPVPPDDPPTEAPTPPPNGGLHIVLLDEAGTPLPGGSFTITDADGASLTATDGGAHDGDAVANGVTVVSGLVAGPATVTQTGTGAGYVVDATPRQASVIADVPDTRVEITNTPIVIEDEETEPGDAPPATMEASPGSGDEEEALRTAREMSIQAEADIFFNMTTWEYARGEHATIRLFVSHRGGDPVTDFHLTAPLPSAPMNGAWEITSDPSSTCTIDQNTASLLCDDFGLASNAFLSIELQANVNAGAACGTYTNTATLTWNNGDASLTRSGGIIVSCPDNVTFTNTIEPATVAPGGDVTITLTFTKDTEELIFEFELSDALPPGLEDIRWEPSPSRLVDCSLSGNTTLECSALTVLRSESVTIRITGTVSNDASFCGQTITNTATASGQIEAPSAPRTEWNVPDASATVECEPGLVVTTTATQLNGEPITPDDEPLPGVQPGDLLTYAVDVENTGNVALADIAIADGADGGTIASLAPDDTATHEVTSTVTLADLNAGQHTTCATASTTFQNQSVTSTEDCATVMLAQQPSLDLAFSEIHLNGEPVTDPVSGVQAGDAIAFTLTATNTGNVSLTGLDMASTLVDTLECTPPTPVSLDPGGILACTGTYTVTQADLDAGAPIVLKATASGTFAPPLTQSGIMTFAQVGEPVTATTSLTLYPAVAGPALGLAQVVTTPDGEPVAEGAEITFTFTVTNPGNVTMDNVVVETSLPGLVWAADTAGSVGTLAPQETVELVATYLLTAEDVAAGTIQNTATAIGDGPACLADPDAVGCGIRSAPAEVTLAVAQPEPTPSPTPDATPEPTVEATPQATPDATPEAATPMAPAASTPTPEPGTVISSLPNTGTGSGPSLPAWGWTLGLLAAIALVATAAVTRRHVFR